MNWNVEESFWFNDSESMARMIRDQGGQVGLENEDLVQALFSHVFSKPKSRSKSGPTFWDFSLPNPTDLRDELGI
ncbi:MAG: hypothetical protein HC835_03295 [Oscillatoriales cyanobacterium RM2_1_1]|nr:hypothetical protein [Oscillatoriales cyanobacterium SM2_3_0]NJO44719.1 hypothetical protein [Oscillatoriales cyanobacterium RM2_1_1]